MFDQLHERLNGALQRLRGRGRLSEKNISDALRDVRMALLEADVALPVARAFIEQVRERAIGQEVLRSLNPSQAVIKVVHEELVRLMGQSGQGLNLATRPPAVILVAGLQGAGETTTVGKLGRWLRERDKRRVLAASTDVYRPAEREQLRRVAEQAGIGYAPGGGEEPVAIAAAAVAAAERRGFDVVLIDTAGRLHVDAPMMDEIRAIHSAIEPVETLFVVDSMTGQDAVNTAAAFDQVLALTGVILTKTDGDARGGAALSIRHVTGKPIKFLGTGEKLDALEAFHPERMASRLLGMGDIVTLVEETRHHADREQAEKLARKIGKKGGFDLDDLRAQVLQLNRMGGMGALLDKLPGAGRPASMPANDTQTRQVVAIIDSMTPTERCRPEMIRGSRKRRIATGSGTRVQDVNRLLKQFTQMRKMMKRMGKGGLHKMAQAMQGRFPGAGL